MEPTKDLQRDEMTTIESVYPVQRLLEIVRGKEESLEQLLNLIQAADANGILKTIGYLIDDCKDLLDAAINKLASPETFKLMSTLTILKDTAKAIQPDPLPKVSKGLNGLIQGMVHRDATVEVNGVLDLIKLLRDPDIRHALSILFSGLKSFGKVMRDTH